MKDKKWQRRLIIYFREVILRLKAFRGVLILFLLLITIGTITIKARLKLSLLHTIYESIALLFFAADIEFPVNDPILQMLWILYPVTGLILLAETMEGLGKVLKLSDYTSPIYNKEMTKFMENHIIIVGIGNIGLKILNSLVEEDDEEITIIDLFENEDKDEKVKEYAKRDKITLIAKDGTREESLREAGIERARVILVLTNNDLVNLKIAQKAKTINPRIRTVVRMFDLEFGEDIKEKLGFDEVLSTSSIAVGPFKKAIKPEKPWKKEDD